MADRHGVIVNGVTSCVTSERDDVVCGVEVVEVAATGVRDR